MYFIKRLDGKGHGDAVKETLTSLSSERSMLEDDGWELL